MERLAYYRISTDDQSIESQRAAMAGVGVTFDREYSDQGISGTTLAAERPGFAELLAYARKGDVVHVYAVDRLGRDAIDVQKTVRLLIDKGVSVDVYGLGLIAEGVGELIVAVLAQVAQMERRRILERTKAGREVAKQALKVTGKTHRGAASLGRPVKADAGEVLAWRRENGASISATAERFGLSVSTVKRYAGRKFPGVAGG